MLSSVPRAHFLYNNGITRRTGTVPLHVKSVAVREMNELLKPMLTDGSFEHDVCKLIRVEELLDAARLHSPDRIGVEVVDIAQRALCQHMRTRCVSQRQDVLCVTKMTIGEHTSMASYDWFKKSDVAKRYPFGKIGISTGFRHDQKPDGLWAFELYHRQHRVHRWILNVEVDGDGKGEKGIFQILCNKMWQAVDFQRVYQPNATTFTLRTNLYRMYSSMHSVEDLESMTVPELEQALQRAKAREENLGDGRIDTHETRDKNKIRILSDLLLKFTYAHVHFMCVMLRTVCCKGALYESMYLNTDSVPGTDFFDVHAFLGAFTLQDVPETRIQLQPPLCGPDIHNNAGTWEIKRQDNDHGKPICTIPSVFGAMGERRPWCTAWQAKIVKHTSTANVVAPDVAVQFICVQRVNMPRAVRKEHTEYAAARARHAAGAAGMPLGIQSNASFWHGVWYTADIVMFLQNVVKQHTTHLPIDVTVSNSEAPLGHFGLFYNNNFAGEPHAAEKEAFQARIAGGGNFNNTKKFHYSMNDKSKTDYPNALVNNSNFHYTSGCHEFVNGENWVVHSIADEMQNAMLALWWQNVHRNTDPAESFTYRQDACIRWETNAAFEGERTDIKLSNLLATVKRMQHSFNVDVLTRKGCKIPEEFQKLDGVYISSKKSGKSLRSYCLRDVRSNLPSLDPDLADYIANNFNCPDLYIFLQMVRCNSKLAMRELVNHMNTSESTRTQCDRLLAQFPVVMQSEIMNALNYARDDPHILSVQITLTRHEVVDPRVFDNVRTRMLGLQDAFLQGTPAASDLFDMYVSLDDIPLFAVLREFGNAVAGAVQGVPENHMLHFTPMRQQEHENGTIQQYMLGNGWMQQWLDDGHGEDSIQWAVLMWYKLMEQQYDKAKRCALIVFRDTAREQLLLWAWTQRFLRQAIQDPCSEWPDYDFEVRPQLVARVLLSTAYVTKYRQEAAYEDPQTFMRETHQAMAFLYTDDEDVKLRLYDGIGTQLADMDVPGIANLDNCSLHTNMSRDTLFLHRIVDDSELLITRLQINNYDQMQVTEVNYIHRIFMDCTIVDTKWTYDGHTLFVLLLTSSEPGQYFIRVTSYDHVPFYEIFIPQLGRYSNLCPINEGRFLVLSCMTDSGQKLFLFHRSLLYSRDREWYPQYTFIPGTTPIFNGDQSILFGRARISGAERPRVEVFLKDGNNNIMCCVMFLAMSDGRYTIQECRPMVPVPLPEGMRDAAAYNMQHDIITVHNNDNGLQQQRAIVQLLVPPSGPCALRVTRVERTTARTTPGGNNVFTKHARHAARENNWLAAARRIDSLPAEQAWPYYNAYHSTSTIHTRAWDWVLLPRIRDRQLQLKLEHLPDDENDAERADGDYDEVSGHYQWQWRRSLQQRVNMQDFLHEQPDHVCVELKTLAAASWLLMKQDDALAFGAGVQSSECAEFRPAGAAEEHHPVRELVQHLRGRPTPWYLPRAVFHNYAFDGDDDIPDAGTETEIDTVDELLSMAPMLWDCLTTDAWYMRELVYSAFVCWRTLDLTGEHIANRARNWSSYEQAFQDLRVISIPRKLMEHAGVLTKMRHDTMHMVFPNIEFASKLPTQFILQVIARFSTASTLRDFVRMRQAMYTIRAVHCRHELFKAVQDDNHPQNALAKQFIQARREAVFRRLCVAWRWKRMLLILNTREPLMLQRMYCGYSLREAEDNCGMTRMTNVTVTTYRTFTDAIADCVNHIVGNTQFTDGEDKTDINNLGKVPRDQFCQLLAMLLRSFQNTTCVDAIREKTMCHLTKEQIDTLYDYTYGHYRVQDNNANHMALDPNWNNKYLYDDITAIDFLWL